MPGPYPRVVHGSEGNDSSPTDATVLVNSHSQGLEDLEAALPNKQPLDADLTAIAALSTTAYGRSLLTAADAAGAQALLTSTQPLDSDLTAIAALTTTSFGRSFLALADAAAAQGILTSTAPLASPTFTGTPAAPTAAVATDTTQVATTAFVGLRSRVTHPNTDDVLVQVWDVANARWQVAHYDSGWRNVSSSLINGWTGVLHVRRIGQRAHWRAPYVGIDGTAASGVTLFDPSGLPTGFSRDISFANETRVLWYRPSGAVVTSAYWFQSQWNAPSFGAGTDRYTFFDSFSYTTPSTIPASLPGSLYAAAPA